MFIVPMSSSITPMTGITTAADKDKIAQNEASGLVPFKEIFDSLLTNAVETAEVSSEDATKVMLGEIDDLHTVGINAQKAAIALELFVTVKNQAIAAYNEIIKMQL